MQKQWPPLDWPEWQATAETLHLRTQIVGKTRLDLTPLQNHWWNIALYVSTRGLTTSPMALPSGEKLEIEFDFLDHLLRFRLSGGQSLDLLLHAQSVASFYAEYLGALQQLNIPVHIWPTPVELPAPTPFDQDHAHASYDPEAAQRFHRILLSVDTVLKRFATGFLGKQSPVHFFWGSFDLCVTRFSGRLASEAQPAAPPKPDPVQQEAYSHEVSSAGFWPGNGGLGYPAFYCYAAPVPAGLGRKADPPRRLEPNSR